LKWLRNGGPLASCGIYQIADYVVLAPDRPCQPIIGPSFVLKELSNLAGVYPWHVGPQVPDRDIIEDRA
jgi:hypothetical protein